MTETTTTETTTEMTTTTVYVPVWARADNPTATMTETEMRAYYKRTDLEASVRFYLTLTSIPNDLRAVYQTLLERLEARKSTPADKIVVGQVKNAIANARDGRPYVVPVLADEVIKTRKRKTNACVCPNCGLAIAA